MGAARGEQGVDPADQPEPEEEGRRGETGGYFARCPENADEDGVSDQRGDSEGDAEDLEEAAALPQGVTAPRAVLSAASRVDW